MAAKYDGFRLISRRKKKHAIIITMTDELHLAHTNASSDSETCQKKSSLIIIIDYIHSAKAIYELILTEQNRKKYKTKSWLYGSVKMFMVFIR